MEQHRETVTWYVPSISCGSCEAAIRNALGRMEGIHAIEPSHQTKQVTVTLDPATAQPSSIEATLAQIGHPPSGRVDPSA